MKFRKWGRIFIMAVDIKEMREREKKNVLNLRTDETDVNSNNSTVKMSICEFINQCEACGGHVSAMILTGIKKVFPDDYEAVRSKYNSITFNEGKVKASEFLYNWITVHGVYSEREKVYEDLKFGSDD